MQKHNSSPRSGSSRSSSTTHPKPSAHRRSVRSTAVRRDGHQPRPISSNLNSFDTIYAREAGLRPARDTGISLQSRRQRRQVQVDKRANRAVVAVVLFLVLLLTSGLIWMNSSNSRGQAIAQKEASLDPMSASNPLEIERIQKNVPVIQASNVVFSAKELRANPCEESYLKRAATLGISSVTPTPQFATFGDIKLSLPVGVEDLTQVGFHRASSSYAQPLETTLAIMPDEAVKGAGGTKRDKSLQPTSPGALLMGSTFEMPRSRDTKRRSAVDVGAPAGSLVVSPITGMVVKVSLYNYEGRVDDYEVHIQPDGHPNLEIVLIHIENPVVSVGDTVEAGVTPVAMVRQMSQYIKNQLADYSGTDGNHVHVQINKIDDPLYIKRHVKDKKTITVKND